MQAYRVGGSVRDELLGLPVADRDWVVVDATPQEMIDQGFRPVGKDFPVFLHPHTREEYALARTERKIGPGYKGFAVHFAPGVTLQEDLARRDLTINAIAQASDGRIIDPFGGRADLKARVLRHVSDSFAEDPVRILRVARFAARFADFEVAPATLTLMQRMSAAGEVDALVSERVWQELSRGLMEPRPSRMIEVLQGAGALHVLLPEVGGPNAADASVLRWPQWLAALDRCAARRESLPVSYAVLLARAKATNAADGAVQEVSRRLRATVQCRDLAALFARERQALLEPGAAGEGAGLLSAVSCLDPPGLLQLLERCDAWRRPARVTGMIHAAAATSGADPAKDPGAIRLLSALAAAGGIDQGAIARRHRGRPEAIRDAIHRERLRLIAGAAER